MPLAVVVTPAGGLPVTEAPTGYGMPMVEATNGYGMLVTFSAGGIPVSGISAFIPGSPVSTVAPVISGTASIGSVLSCTTGSWSPAATTYAYHWRRNGALITGATASTYTLVAADNAAAMTCRVIASNAIGPSAPAYSNVITLPDITPVNSVPPAITGTAAVGSVLTVTNGTWSNSPSFTRQWRRNGSAIGGATATTYTLVAADNIAIIDCVVTATNAVAAVIAYSNSVTVAEARPVNSVAPAVTGAPTVGFTLSCSTGTWSNTPSSYAYQWLRNGINISGATTSTYLLVLADDGTTVTCTVTASNAVGAGSPAVSNGLVIGTSSPSSGPIGLLLLTMGVR